MMSVFPAVIGWASLSFIYAADHSGREDECMYLVSNLSNFSNVWRL